MTLQVLFKSPDTPLRKTEFQYFDLQPYLTLGGKRGGRKTKQFSVSMYFICYQFVWETQDKTYTTLDLFFFPLHHMVGQNMHATYMYIPSPMLFIYGTLYNETQLLQSSCVQLLPCHFFVFSIIPSFSPWLISILKTQTLKC